MLKKLLFLLLILNSGAIYSAAAARKVQEAVPARDPDPDYIDNNNHDVQGHVEQRSYAVEIFFDDPNFIPQAKIALEKNHFGKFVSQRNTAGFIGLVYDLEFRIYHDEVIAEIKSIFATHGIRHCNIRCYQSDNVFFDEK